MMKTDARRLEIVTKYADMLELHWGLEVGDGWVPVVDDLFANIAALLKQRPIANFKIVQVKEKFGGLRVYTRHASPAILKLIDAAERICAETCETCGGKGSMQESGWMRVICDPCEERRDK
jgi:hypothetical protein